MPDEYRDHASDYDAIYEDMKDYRREADRVHELIQAHKHTGGTTLLDVACGTGLHDQYLTDRYQLEGLDFSEAMLASAKKRLPETVFHQGDMSNFDLGRQFDVVTCLFSSIGHMKTKDKLSAAIACMARHLKPGGVLVVEPWITPDQWRESTVSTDFVPEKKVARITRSTRNGNLSHLEMHHFVDWDETTGTAKYFQTHHDVAMYTIEEYKAAFRAAGLDVSYDEEGLMGRGVYVGIKNS